MGTGLVLELVVVVARVSFPFPLGFEVVGDCSFGIEGVRLEEDPCVRKDTEEEERDENEKRRSSDTDTDTRWR